MPRTSELSSTNGSRTPQARKPHGRTTKKHAQRDGSVKYNGDRDKGTCSSPARDAAKALHDWVTAAQGDPNIELEATPFAPGLSELAGLRWDIEAAGNRQNSWVDDYPYGNLLDSDPYENWGGSDPYDRIADDMIDYWGYDPCTCDDRRESQQRHEDEYRDPWFPLRTIDPHYYWVQPDQWYKEETWLSEEPSECRRERWSSEGILLHCNLPKSRIARIY